MLISVARHRRFYENILFFELDTNLKCPFLHVFLKFLYKSRTKVDAGPESISIHGKTAREEACRDYFSLKESLPSSSVLTSTSENEDEEREWCWARTLIRITQRFAEWCSETDRHMLGLMQRLEKSPNKSPFQLLCVCSVILSVSSAFQRPVLEWL